LKAWLTVLVKRSRELRILTNLRARTPTNQKQDEAKHKAPYSFLFYLSSWFGNGG